MKGRVGGDRVAAAHLLDGGGSAASQDDNTRDGKGQDARKGNREGGETSADH